MKPLSPYSLICLLAIVSVGSAQYVSRYERPISPPFFFVTETDTVDLRLLNEDSLIAVQIGDIDTTILAPKSTTIALLSSMALPGAGQIYNESYWKAPVVWGLGYYFFSIYQNQDKLYKEHRSIYEGALSSMDTATVSGDKAAFSAIASRNKDLRDYYKRQRNEFGWYLALTYILNVMDAYVDAALFNFEVSPNLQGTNDWQMRVRIPIRK